MKRGTKLLLLRMRSTTDGMVEISYIYVFLISALILMGITLSISFIMQSSNETATQVEMESLANRIVRAIQEANNFGMLHPHATWYYMIELPTTVEGYSYTVRIVNSTELQIVGPTRVIYKASIPKSKFEVKTQPETGIPSDAGKLYVVYEGTNEIILKTVYEPNYRVYYSTYRIYYE